MTKKKNNVALCKCNRLLLPIHMFSNAAKELRLEKKQKSTFDIFFGICNFLLISYSYSFNVNTANIWHYKISCFLWRKIVTEFVTDFWKLGLNFFVQISSFLWRKIVTDIYSVTIVTDFEKLLSSFF